MNGTATSFDLLLSVIAGAANRDARLGLVYMSAKERMQFADLFPATARRIGTDIGAVHAEVSFFLSVRLLWELVPARLFTAVAPNFEDLAASALEKHGASTSETRRQLSTVFRRMRSSRLQGRSTTSLDLESRRHKALFESQNRRCALCNYEFIAPDCVYSLDDDDDVYVYEHVPRAGEVALDRYYRRPVLDHIIPYFFGGDQAENWQILCQTCNLGKGESLSWLSRRGWAPSTRLSELFSLTASLRFAVLADFRSSQHNVADAEVRLFKCDASRLVYYDNLECKADY